MSSNKRTSKVKNGILFAVVIAFLIAIIGGTYARYSSSGRANGTGEIAKWNIKLGNQDISSETKTIDVNLTPDEESNANTTSGKLAPGQVLSGTFKVDPTGSEVAVDYLLTIGSVQATSGTWNAGSELSLSKVTALVEDETEATELTIAEGGATYFENLTDVLNGKDVTFKIYVTWDNSNDANNVADAANGSAITQITIPVTVVVRQHIGDGQATPTISQTTYTVIYNSNGGTGTMQPSSHTIGISKALNKNSFTNENFQFLGWSTNQNATEATYCDEEEVLNLSNVDGDTVTLYAIWNNLKDFSFDITNSVKSAKGTILYSSIARDNEMPSLYYVFTGPAKSALFFPNKKEEDSFIGFLYKSPKKIDAITFDWARCKKETGVGEVQIHTTTDDWISIGSFSTSASVASGTIRIVVPEDYKNLTLNGFRVIRTGGSFWHNDDSWWTVKAFTLE